MLSGSVSKASQCIPFAAGAGEVVSLSFSPGYAAPEVIQAYQAGQRSMPAHPAADIWALGVIAFEMLTKERAFGACASAEDMLRRSVSAEPLPWEDPSPEAQSMLRELRGLKRAILQCLDRDPVKRPTSEALLHSWNHMFDSTRTSPFTKMSDSSGDQTGQ
jgi:serine/threonine protein kinase